MTNTNIADLRATIAATDDVMALRRALMAAIGQLPAPVQSKRNTPDEVRGATAEYTAHQAKIAGAVSAQLSHTHGPLAQRITDSIESAFAMRSTGHICSYLEEIGELVAKEIARIHP